MTSVRRLVIGVGNPDRGDDGVGDEVVRLLAGRTPPDVGLLRQVAVDGSKTYFDTNVSQHHHFFVEGENDLLDIPHADVVVGKTPIPPEGYEVARIDVVVRLRRKPR